MTELGIPLVSPKDINDAGLVVGSYAHDANEVARAFLWKDGRLTDLGTLDNSYSIANAINHMGVIVGNSIVVHGPPTHHAVVWYRVHFKSGASLLKILTVSRPDGSQLGAYWELTGSYTGSLFTLWLIPTLCVGSA